MTAPLPNSEQSEHAGGDKNEPSVAPTHFDPAKLAADLRRAGAGESSPSQAASSEPNAPRVAVVIPCYNEATTIADVIADFRTHLPQAVIAVFDNASTDGTGDAARAAGADVYLEPRRGKGNVVRRMFAEIDADVYLMVDGDGTYEAAAAPKLVSMIVDDRLDMAIGARANVTNNAHRTGHAFGNRLFNRLFAGLFGQSYCDIFSGYRAFSRRLVKSFPALSSGFEIETELSVHASQMRLPVAEFETKYSPRPEGSQSKLRSVRDGIRILRAFLFLLKETRPILFFGSMAGAAALAAIVLAIPLVETWLATGLVPRFPTAILCVGLAIISSLLAICGIILDSLSRARVEHKRILYLAVANLAGRRRY
ncbi:MAG: glycosyltransferase [Beijerinckiaceae bacterium]